MTLSLSQLFILCLDELHTHISRDFLDFRHKNYSTTRQTDSYWHFKETSISLSLSLSRTRRYINHSSWRQSTSVLSLSVFHWTNGFTTSKVLEGNILIHNKITHPPSHDVINSFTEHKRPTNRPEHTRSTRDSHLVCQMPNCFLFFFL